MGLFRPRRRALVLGVTVAVVAGAAAAGFALTRPSSGDVIRYRTAEEMAARAGCSDTFTAVPAATVVLSAGHCRIDGAVVHFRVLPSVEAAFAWHDGYHLGHPVKPYSAVGDGWVAETSDRAVANRVGQALTSTP